MGLESSKVPSMMYCNKCRYETEAEVRHEEFVSKTVLKCTQCDFEQEVSTYGYSNCPS